MSNKEYENSLEKLLRTLFKNAENQPMFVGDPPIMAGNNSLQLVEAILKIHHEIDDVKTKEKHDAQKQQHVIAKEVSDQIKKANDDLCKKLDKSMDL